MEITGPDKAWIAEQLEKLMPVLLGAAQGTAGRTPKQESAGSSDSTEKKARTRRGGGSTGKSNPDLSAKLTNDVRAKLETYWNERIAKAKTAQDQAPVIATFLLDELAWAEVTGDDLFTVYSEMGWKIPATANALANATNRKNYFAAPKDGKYRVSHAGQNFARHDSKS